MNVVVDAFFALLRNEICETPLPESVFSSFDSDLRASVVKLAERQDLAHLLYDALLRNELLTENDPEYPALSKAQMLAVYRATEQAREYAHVKELFAAEKIGLLPLKGIVLRGLYPVPWMRTAADIDLLLPKEKVDRAEALLAAEGYNLYFRTPHDVSYTGATGVHIELHRTLSAKGEESELYSPLLANTWDRLLPGEEPKMPDDLFYFYHIFHMAVHFKIGGCGVRPLLDLWLINHKMPGDPAAREKLLEQEGLLTFARNMERLSEVWFSCAESDAFLDALSTYLLLGGSYGTDKTAAYAKEGAAGGRRRYRLSRVFLPFAELKEHYPVLTRHPWLYPFLTVARWFRALLPHRRRDVQKTLAGGEQTEKTLGLPAEKFWSQVGLP